MKLYEGTLAQFRDDVATNQIADKISNHFENYYGRRPQMGEYNAWNNSLNFLKNAVDSANLTDNSLIIEYELPYTSQRIDVVLFGRDEQERENVVLIEMKQWSKVEETEVEDNVITFIAGANREEAHPSVQVRGYHYYLADFMEVFEKHPPLILNSCAYMHNYRRTPGEGIYSPRFTEIIRKFPVFSKEDSQSIADYLRARLCKGNGLEILNRFSQSSLRPSKKLLTHLRERSKGERIFTLVDDQIAAYNAIMHKARRLAQLKTKSVIIVKGGPGTGKSVIALEVMFEIMSKKIPVFHATGSSAFTKTLRKILGSRAQNLFKFFFSFTQHKDNEIPVLICDEAHRIRRDSNDYGVPYKYKSKLPQVDDLIRPAKLSIFFIDEHQVVRPNEVGNAELIRLAARKYGASVHEFELQTQFRCSGSDAFLQWIENTLGIRETAHPFLTNNERMDFRIFDSPIELRDTIFEKNDEKKNSARLVAGFCWPWSDPNPDGTLVKDVKVDGLEMPWELKHGKKALLGIPDASLWAYEDGGINQVGTVYTIQGFEFDYVGVIFGSDLAYDPQLGNWKSNPNLSYDTQVTRRNPELTQHLKNVYRVLLSRAHKGCYVYFADKNTENYFRSRIKKF